MQSMPINDQRQTPATGGLVQTSAGANKTFSELVFLAAACHAFDYKISAVAG